MLLRLRHHIAVVSACQRNSMLDSNNSEEQYSVLRELRAVPRDWVNWPPPKTEGIGGLLTGRGGRM